MGKGGRSEWGRGKGGGFRNDPKSEILRMKYPVIENVRTPSDILMDTYTFRVLQLPYQKKFANWRLLDVDRFFNIPYFFRIFFIVGEITAWVEPARGTTIIPS